MKAKDINIYNIFSATYKKRKMFSFMGFGELSIMPKVDKPIRQISNVYQFPIKQYYNQRKIGLPILRNKRPILNLHTLLRRVVLYE